MSRYSRQELFAPVGKKGQARIAKSHVLLVGCGALGTHLAEFCARTGVRELTIIDRDVIDESNLQRQSLFTEADLESGLPKAEAARRHLTEINSGVRVNAVVGEFSPENAEKLADGADLILDGTDNFETRMLINDLSVKLGIPWIYAACVASRAVCMPVIPGKTACLCCLLEDQPGGGETCDTSGIIMPAVLGAVAMASSAALKVLSGRRKEVLPRLISVDYWSGERSSLDASRARADCPACAGRQFKHLAKTRAKTAVICGRDSVQLAANQKFEFTDARKRLRAATRLLADNDFLVRFGHGTLEMTLFADGRALVHGTKNSAVARSFYSRFVGN